MENLTVWHFLKLYFSGLKIILSFLQNIKKQYFWLDFSDTIPFWSKNHSFLSKISKTISSDLIIPKKPNEKKFDFWTKTMDYPLTIMSIFWHFLKRYFSGLEIFLFYPKYEKKCFLTWSFQKNPNEKKSDFWTKTMDQALRKMSFLALFNGSIFWSKNHFFPSTRSKNNLYWLVLSKRNK